MLRTTTSRNWSRSKGRRCARAFTLVELVIVLLVIAAMVTVAVPYATRSSESRKLEDVCRDLAETIKYAMSYALDTQKRTRLAVDVMQGSYVIEASRGANEDVFEPLEDSRAGLRLLGAGLRILDYDGFQPIQGNRYGLVFDVSTPWPQARLSLTLKDMCRTVTITGRLVAVEGKSMD